MRFGVCSDSSVIVIGTVSGPFPRVPEIAVARSCFSDWSYEMTSFSDSVIEAALHHRIPGGGTVSAYKRGDQIDRRRALLAAWSDFLLAKDKIVALRPVAATA